VEDDKCLNLGSAPCSAIGYIVAVLAERLNFANRALGVLQR